MVNYIQQKAKAAASAAGSVLKPATWKEKGLRWSIGIASLLFFILMLVLAIYWSRTPDQFDVHDKAVQLVGLEQGAELAPGSVTTAALISVSKTLLDKPGGFLSNDVLPPSVFLDNMPNWEFGVLVQVRDLARALRNDMSRSQSQSLEDRDLMVAEPQFNINNESWVFPSAEGSYGEGIDALESYLSRLVDTDVTNAQFYARADNLVNWLRTVEKRLGGLSQSLSASVGQSRVNTDMAGDAAATQSTPTPENLEVKTPWTKLDDNFFEARGAAWALLHFLKAVEIDFEPVLRKKNAVVSLRQIIRELESTQDPVWSPIILNGSGFGLVANHSLVMASYISRANAAIIDLRNLLVDG
ncbi:MAG: DUF2333 family protein [Gammaproteobacteria bacterium]|nr:MAG: DUF2333 family protein [Gammaproteobacteria bacterium]